MDTKRLIGAIAAGLAAILLYYTLVLPWIDRHWAEPQTGRNSNGPIEATSQPSTLPTTVPTSQSAIATTQNAPQSQPVPGNMTAAAATNAQVVPATQPSINQVTATVGSPRPKDAQFAMQLSILPTGGGLDSVILNAFRKTAQGKDPYVFQQPLAGRLDTEPMGSRNVTVNGSTYDLAGVQWSLVSTSATSVTYAADLAQNGRKLLSLTKTFEVYPVSDANLGYEIRVEYAFQNPTDAAQTIRTTFNGPTLPPPETNRPPDRQVIGGYVVDKDSVELTAHPIEDFRPDKNAGEIDMTKDAKGRPARWAGAESNYFAAVVLPLDMRVNGTATNPNYISRIVAHGVNIDKDVPSDDHQAYVTFETSEFKVEKGQTVVLPMAVYMGPKWREILDKPYYTASPRKYDLLLVVRASMCGISFCSFPWLADAITYLLGWMHFIFRDWGLGIIGLVAIVRLILHPITRQSQISMSRMSKMAPEMERLRKKYGDDKEALNKAMVEFHREQGLGPYLGCLPMFLQMPIWIALYGVLQSSFSLRHAPFLWNLTWIHDLSQPDRLIQFNQGVKLPFIPEIHAFNLLPVFLSAAMVAQQRFMPKPAAATPEQMQQQKMMQWLSPIMFLFFFYSLPSGLNLYIFTSTAVGVIESKIIRDHLKKREEAEKAGRVFVETKPTRGSRQGPLGPSERPGPRGGPVGWVAERWAKLLEHAEQVRQEQEKRGNGKKR